MKRFHDAWIALAVTVLALLASAGWVRTNVGDNQMAFWTSGALCLFAAGLALGVGRQRIRTRSIQPLGEVLSS